MVINYAPQLVCQLVMGMRSHECEGRQGFAFWSLRFPTTAARCEEQVSELEPRLSLKRKSQIIFHGWHRSRWDARDDNIIHSQTPGICTIDNTCIQGSRLLYNNYRSVHVVCYVNMFTQLTTCIRSCLAHHMTTINSKAGCSHLIPLIFPKDVTDLN